MRKDRTHPTIQNYFCHFVVNLLRIFVNAQNQNTNFAPNGAMLKCKIFNPGSGSMSGHLFDHL